MKYVDTNGVEIESFDLSKGKLVDFEWIDHPEVKQEGHFKYKTLGGGGLYGGRVSPYANNHEPSSKSGGGSGYIGGVPTLTYSGATYGSGTSNGQRSGSGYAVITLVKKGELPVIFNGTQLTAIIYNETTIEHLVYNGQQLY